ncbi:MAG TPA: AAA family ATPase, partial [Tabrizicola sp.]
AVALDHLEGIPLDLSLGGPSPYAHPVFLAPPWPEIYATDPERQHGFDEAVAEFDRLALALPALGHRVVMLPKLPVADRVAFVLHTLS